MRTPDVLFRVELKSVESLYSQPGSGFYIPPYQRPYTWGNEQVDRLAEDLSSGLREWLYSEDTVTFLGSIILLKDDLFDQVEPAIKEHLPSEVMVVIDGQQRLCTLALLGTLLHEELARRGRQVVRLPFPGSQWLENKYKQTEFRLRPLFELNVGVGDFPLYPKLIRAYYDQWSHDRSIAKYSSPIGRYLSQYIELVQGNGQFRQFRPVFEGFNGRIILQVVKRFRKYLNLMIEGIGSDGERIFGIEQHFPDDTQRHVFRQEIPADLYRYSLTTEGRPALELLNLVALSNYFLTRCSITLTVPMEDRFAFELFERLNTTGQQLTAYETFKPLVVKSESLAEYRESESYGSISVIDKFVPEDMPYDKRLRSTHDLLIPFAMSEKGDRLAKKLGQQRNWMRSTYESLVDIESKRRFVAELKNLVVFLEDYFRYGKADVSEPTHPDLLKLTNGGISVVCLDYLKRAKNEICIGPLSRYFSDYASNPTPESAVHFEQAVKASAAFFTLYRWAFGTSGLPDAYMRLMRSGDIQYNLKAMGRLVQDSAVPSGIEYGEFLGRCLCKRLNGGKDSWVKRVKTRPIFTNSALTKFALHAALYDTTENRKIAGLAMPSEGDATSLDMLSLEKWCENPQVVHIAPRVRTSGWSDDLYDGETADLIGNLVLIPDFLSDVANSGSWSRKRLYYRVLSSPDRIVQYMDSDEVDLTSLTPTNLQDLKNSNLDALVVSIANVAEDWNSETVLLRSEQLATLVWNRLSPWLGLQNK